MAKTKELSKRQPRNLNDLERICKEQWDKIPPEHAGACLRGVYVSTWWPGVAPAPPEIWLATPGAPLPDVLG